MPKPSDDVRFATPIKAAYIQAAASLACAVLARTEAPVTAEAAIAQFQAILEQIGTPRRE